ncbi:MAG: AI-2E family transporter [Betaproteobacteria bacterium]|nr:AI-2E family transporter [Betaproteobacteria bacterium]
MPDTTPRRFAQIALGTLLLLGCAAVLLPFVGAIMFAAVLCVTTWSLFQQLLTRCCRGRETLAALLMTSLLILIVLLPMFFFAAGLVDGIEFLILKVKPMLTQEALEIPPKFLLELPWVGERIGAHWSELTENREELNRLAQMLFEPARKVLGMTAVIVGEGILQLILVIFIAFFLYRDGTAIARQLNTGAQRLGGAFGVHMLGLARSTVTGVMVGIVGTAVAQALVALAGFLIAGVPMPLLLAFATFFLSMIPVGPPLIWGGAAFWLYDQGETGLAIFMVLWGLLAISSVDNFIKPLLISRSSSLPILLIALGVFGGVLVFGFIGVFLGPTLLALGHALMQHWTGGNGAAPLAGSTMLADSGTGTGSP